MLGVFHVPCFPVCPSHLPPVHHFPVSPASPSVLFLAFLFIIMLQLILIPFCFGVPAACLNSFLACFDKISHFLVSAKPWSSSLLACLPACLVHVRPGLCSSHKTTINLAKKLFSCCCFWVLSLLVRNVSLTDVIQI